MSKPDEPDYWCAHCLAKLPPDQHEEIDCPKCGHAIATEDDYLDEIGIKVRRRVDQATEDAARRDGLIQ